MIIKHFKIHDKVISIGGPQKGIIGVVVSTKPSVDIVTTKIKVKPNRKTFIYSTKEEYERLVNFCKEWSSVKHWEILV